MTSLDPEDADEIDRDFWARVIFAVLAMLFVSVGLIGMALGDEPGISGSRPMHHAPMRAAQRFGQADCLAADWPSRIYSSRETCLMARDAVEARVEIILRRRERQAREN